MPALLRHSSCRIHFSISAILPAIIAMSALLRVGSAGLPDFPTGPYKPLNQKANMYGGWRAAHA